MAAVSAAATTYMKYPFASYLINMLFEQFYKYNIENVNMTKEYNWATTNYIAIMPPFAAPMAPQK